MATEYIFKEIRAERRRQNEKFGEQNYQMRPDDFDDDRQKRILREMRRQNDNGKASWYTILGEELLEAFLETEPEKQREEMIQVAAVAVAICDDCLFARFCRVDFACNADERADGKNVIFKLVDLPGGENKN